MPAAPRTPSGVPLKDGYQTVITFTSNATVQLFEKTVQPPGLDGGDKVDTTTMHNVDMRTYAPRFLKEGTDVQMTVAYDPAVLTAILALINVNDEITVTFSDGSTWVFWGFLRSFTPASIEEGSQPEATCTICLTNTDGDNADAEIKPVYAAAAP